MSLIIGPVEADRRLEWRQLQDTVFAFEAKDGDIAMFDAWTEWDRVFAAFDGDAMIGSAENLSLTMTVPGGGTVPMAGLTSVAVLPTHRRRGALTSMVRAGFEDARNHGEPVVGLWASESSIYARFGYGTAIEGADLTLERPHTAMLVDRPSAGRMRLLARGAARELVPDVYRRATAGIPGTLGRPPAAWDLYFYDPEHWREGASPYNVAAYEIDGDIRGYVRYRLKEKWEDIHPRFTVTVGDLQAVDADAYAALHRYVFGLDLVETFRFKRRRSREPLLYLLVEPRRLQRRLADQLWLRIIDVPAAMSARRYGIEGELVVEVVDDFCPWAGGRFRLDGGPESAECSPSDRESDVRISAADLASAYLGDSRVQALAWVGKIEGDSESIRVLDRMLSWPDEPFCSVVF